MNYDQNDEKKRPVKSIRYGAVEASIWENDTSGSKSYGVMFARHYKEKDGDAWKSSTSFRPEHLLLLAKVADAAHTAIYTELKS